MAVVHLIFAVRILMSNPCLHVACDQLHGLNIFVGSKLFPFPSGFCFFFARSAAFPSFRLCAISIFSPLCHCCCYCCCCYCCLFLVSARSAIVMKLWIGNIPLQYSHQDVLDDLQAAGHEVPVLLQLHPGKGRHQYGFVTFATGDAAQRLAWDGLCWRQTGKFALVRP